MKGRQFFSKIFKSLSIALMLFVSIQGALAADFSVNSFRSFNNTAADFVFEASIGGTGSYDYTILFGDGTDNTGTLSSNYAYFNHDYTGVFGPVNASFFLGNDDNLSNNKKIINFCFAGTEIPNNGIDEDCTGSDLIVNIPLKITIISPAPTNISIPQNWNIQVKTNNTADSCRYEFGIRDDYWYNPPRYYSITSNGQLNRINNTYFTKSNVNPLGDHNYLRIFCNNTAGQTFNATEHLEIDTTPPGTITDLETIWGTHNDEFNLTFTMPGDDDFNKTGVKYMEIKWSKEPITTIEEWNNASLIWQNKTTCYQYHDGATKVNCYLILPPCNATYSSGGTFYDKNDNELTDIACYAKKDANGTIIKPSFNFNIRTKDNLEQASGLSNPSGNYTPWYDCSIENVILKKKKSTAPFKSDLTRTYQDPEFTYTSPYETLYNYDDIILNISIKNEGDGNLCYYEIYDDNILGKFNNTFDLSFNKTKTFNYTWTILTNYTSIYTSKIFTKSVSSSMEDMDRDMSNSIFNFELVGINISKYMSLERNKIIQTESYGSPFSMRFFVDNNANELNVDSTNKYDTISWRWMPTRLEYIKGQPYYDDFIFSSFDPEMNYTFYPNNEGLPDEFYNYSCNNYDFTTGSYCLKPYSRYWTSFNGIEWSFEPLNYVSDYDIWISAGTYKGEYAEIAISPHTTLFYG